MSDAAEQALVCRKAYDEQLPGSARARRPPGRTGGRLLTDR